MLFGNSEQENILQTITHLIQQTVLEIQFWSVKYTTVTVGYVKFRNMSFAPIQATQAITMVRLNENKPLQNAFKRIKHNKLYSISIILFPKNNLTNICCELSKTGMNL